MVLGTSLGTGTPTTRNRQREWAYIRAITATGSPSRVTYHPRVLINILLTYLLSPETYKFFLQNRKFSLKGTKFWIYVLLPYLTGHSLIEYTSNDDCKFVKGDGSFLKNYRRVTRIPVLREILPRTGKQSGERERDPESVC